MKIFLSALENGSTVYDTGQPLAKYFVENGVKMKWNLMSYYYLRSERQYETACFIRDNSELIMIDSGAHTFQFGKKVDFVQYTKEYAEFIKKFDRPNVVGYFEMDVDNVLGHEKVVELRKILEEVTDKVIPVWHYNRGVEEFIELCKQYSGRTISVTGFKNTDISDEQYIMFVKKAREYNCKIHCLGMTRRKVLDKVPFDYTDSSSWKQSGIYGRIDGRGKVTRDFSKTKRQVVFLENYKYGMKLQEHYYQKWRKVCKD